MVNWIIPDLGSALALGVYDGSRKASMKDNPVLPVLFGATFCGTLLYVLVMLAMGQFVPHWCCGWDNYGFIWIKTLIVGASWYCDYAAMMTLPLSLATPIGATRPLWTFIGGLLIYHEVPTPWKGVGMIMIFVGCFLLNGIGSREGFTFRKSSGMKYCLAGALFAAFSALYDKFLLNVIKIAPPTVQLHFSIDVVILFALALLFAFACRMKVRCHWRWSIPLTGISLILADCAYFYTVSLPDIQISQVTLVRRASSLVTFLISVFIFKEKNIRGKLAALILILLGVAIMALL